MYGIIFFLGRTLLETVATPREFQAEDFARLTALCIYPLIFLAFLQLTSRPETHCRLRRVVMVGVVVVLFYGVLQKVMGEYTILIPGVTANWHDAQILEFLADKSNLLHETGEVKLTSTYQNGNLLGINLLLFVPLAFVQIPQRWMKLTFLSTCTVVLALTASRATWAGAVFLVLIALYLSRLPKLSKLSIVLLFVLSTSVFLQTSVAQTRIVNVPWEELASWGGRMEAASILWSESTQEIHFTMLLLGPWGEHRERIVAEGGGAYEMFYLALYETAGILGVLVWMAPVFVTLRTFYRYRRDVLIRSVLVGLLTWCFVAVAEGAFWLPPTAFNLWALAGIGWLRVYTRAVRQRADSGGDTSEGMLSLSRA
ncbi:MAG: hypothetical protein L0338_38035 [Acidobacteria bacterium]|nr:hypothetical protein [Acidobacteriota bacterium]